MTESMTKYEEELYKKGNFLIAGLDEVGRGCCAGPVVVASVILDKDNIIQGLNDSKKLTKKKRELLFDEIMEKSIECTYVIIDSKEVDELNVYQASKQGMLRCLDKLTKYDYALSDAMPLGEEVKHTSIIKGDTLSVSIAAASIIAKVIRDRYMLDLHSKHPEYGFDKHVGYCTKKHLEMINKHGIISEHRLSFKPVKDYIENLTKQQGNLLNL